MNPSKYLEELDECAVKTPYTLESAAVGAHPTNGIYSTDRDPFEELELS